MQNGLQNTALLFFLLALTVSILPTVASAQESDQPLRATVIRIVSEEEIIIPGTQTRSFTQVLEARSDSGEVFTLQNDRVRVKEGDAFYAFHVVTSEGEMYAFHEPDRRGVLLGAVLLFAFVTAGVGLLTGLRALIALAFGGVVLFGYLLPQLAEGAHPLYTSVAAAAMILGVAMVITHGF